MAGTSGGGRSHGFLTRLEVDVLELRRLSRVGMRYTDQVHERIGRRYSRGVGFSPQPIAVYYFATGRKLRFGAGPGQHAHPMSTSQQLGSQPAAHKARRSCQKDFT